MAIVSIAGNLCVEIKTGCTATLLGTTCDQNQEAAPTIITTELLPAASATGKSATDGLRSKK